VTDLAAVVAPPYDVISPDERRALAARDPRNVVRVDLPIPEPGDQPDEAYRRAARLLGEWRSDGTLRRDVRPWLYAYEQTYRLPGGGAGTGGSTASPERVRRGIFARVDLEPFGRGGGIRPHERTLHAPKEDRYRLLRATGVNTSPVVGMYEEPSGAVAERLEEICATRPLLDIVDDDGVAHRLWQLDPDGLPDRIGANAITIADGHHRYETALRYRDERRQSSPVATGLDEPAAYDSILMLLLEPLAGPVTVLATHRIVNHLGADGLARLRHGLPDLFDVRVGVAGDELEATFSPIAEAPGGGGRFGLWTREGGAMLMARRDAPAFAAIPGGPAVRGLDVSLLGRGLEVLAGIDASAVDAGGRIAYTKDTREAIARVDAADGGADAAFLLDPTPASAIVAVAADGDVMPQKSTYIYPKALTGLVINTLE